MAWALLILAGIFEVGFTTFLKLADNFKNIPWTIAFGICAITSFALLSRAAQTIPLGTSYAVWTGIGAAGTVVVGILFFKEPSDYWRILFITLLIISIVGLKFIAKE